MRNISKHIAAACDQITVLLHEHEKKIATMVGDSETESVTLPISLYISDAPGTQRIKAKLTCTEKSVFSKSVDVETGQMVSEDLAGEDVKKESLKAKQKDNANKEKKKRGAKKKEDADAPA